MPLQYLIKRAYSFDVVAICDTRESFDNKIDQVKH